MGEIRDKNPKCRDCRYVDRCIGGCRNSALLAGGDYYGVDPALCWFFEHDGEARITAAAREPFAAYLKRNPPKKKEPERTDRADVTDCP